MKLKVLLGWELGTGQGHIQRMASLARILANKGFEPVFALKSYHIKGISFSGQTVLAPPLPFSGRHKSYTYADILETFGFGNAKLLRAHLQAWRSILEEVKPSLIIAEHAPGLVLAARGLVPTVVVGDGFTVPPPVEVFPILQFPAPPESEVRQEQVSNTVRSVVKLNASLGQVLNGERSFIYSIPELDPYRHLRDNAQYVSLHITPIPRNLHNANGSAWAYLANGYPFRNLVLQTLKPQCEFKPLKEILAEKSLAIHHGGLTTALACLIAGIPQLILPIHFEQQLNGMALSQWGVAKIITKPTWEELLIVQAQTYELTDNALRVAESLAPWNQNFREIVVKTCLEFLVLSK